MIELIIDCPPVPWASHGGYGRRSYDKRRKEKEYYRIKIREQYKKEPITCAVCIHYTFFMPIPASFSKKDRELALKGRLYHVKKPDCSNLVKLCEDTLKGIVIKDDSQVDYFFASKLYSDNPMTRIYVYLPPTE